MHIYICGLEGGRGAREGGGCGRAGQGGAERVEGNFNGGGGGELIKCIDPNEGEALMRGSTFKPGGLAPPLVLAPP